MELDVLEYILSRLKSKCVKSGLNYARVMKIGPDL